MTLPRRQHSQSPQLLAVTDHHKCATGVDDRVTLRTEEHFARRRLDRDDDDSHPFGQVSLAEVLPRQRTRGSNQHFLDLVISCRPGLLEELFPTRLTLGPAAPSLPFDSREDPRWGCL